MKKLSLTNFEIADLCRELALLLHSGVALYDGLALLAEEEKDGRRKALLEEMAEGMEQGDTLAQAFEARGCFPAYVVGLIGVGEQAGRLEEALNALSRYYEQRERMQRQVRGALTYPAILLMLMLVVIAVLLVKVLPVFNEVYASLGGQLTGVAGGLLQLGRALDAAMPLLWVLLAVAGGAVAAFSLHDGFRDKVTALWRGRWGDRGVSKTLNDARFAQALAMGMGSGLMLEESVELAQTLLQDTPAAVERCRTCRQRLLDGEELHKALGESGMLPAAACRRLALGMRSGAGDQVMEEIAQRLSEEAEQAMQDMAARVEPALVLTASVLVGAILLSVMLPLMNIMTLIG